VPALGSGLLKKLILQLADPNTLTPVHTEFTKLALHAKAYANALSVLDRDIFDADHASESQLTITDVLLFHYYGGMLYAGLGQWEKAVKMWKMALVVPAQLPSAIMVEAHRKLVIASLLASGKSCGLPPAVAPVNSKLLLKINAEYKDLANAYEADLQA
jgi:COP9 signalosome complex subunit 3